MDSNIAGTQYAYFHMTPGRFGSSPVCAIQADALAFPQDWYAPLRDLHTVIQREFVRLMSCLPQFSALPGQFPGDPGQPVEEGCMLPGRFQGFGALPNLTSPLPEADEAPLTYRQQSWHRANDTAREQPVIRQPLPAPAPQPPVDATAQLEQRAQGAVSSNWSKWTHGDDSLSQDRLQTLLKDPNIHGDEASALAVMSAGYDTMRQPGKALKLADVKSYKLNREFGRASTVIESRTHTLFNGTPQAGALQQGTGTADCWFQAALDDKVKNDPESIKKMARDNGDGTYTVTLPGQQPQTVKALTDAQTVIRAHSGSSGEWGSVIDQAEHQIHNGTGHEADEDFASTGVQAVSGHDSSNLTHAYHSDARIGSELDQAINQSKKIVTASTGGRKDDSGLVGNHVYSVQGYDPRTQIVTLRNPVGLSQRGIPSAPVGKDVGIGTFEMKLSDYSRRFSSTTIEGDGKADSALMRTVHGYGEAIAVNHERVAAWVKNLVS